MKTSCKLILTTSSLLALGCTPGRAAEPGVYADVIAPIMGAKCVACHGEEKMKGKLRLDSHAGIMAGGSEGDNVVPGDLEASLMVFRVGLPHDDDEHMPPEDEEQLTPDEIGVIKWWIESGAKKDLAISAAEVPENLKGAVDVILKTKPAAAVAAVTGKDAGKMPVASALTKADEEAIAETIGKVRESGASLMAIAADTPQLRFSALNVAKEFGDGGLALLEPVAAQVWWLDIAGTKVTDKGLAHVAGMKALKRLYLQNTAVTDAGLEQLKGLAGLGYLNLYGTQVSDAGLQKLAGLKNLKKVFVWQTGVTKEGAQALAQKIPGVDINVGWADVEVAAVVAAAGSSVAALKAGEEEKARAAAEELKKKAAAEAAKKKAAEQAQAAQKPGAIRLMDNIAKAVADANRIAAEAKKVADEAAEAGERAWQLAEKSRKKAEELAKAADEVLKARAAVEAQGKPEAASKPAEQKPRPRPRPKPRKAKSKGQEGK